jgi:hypothetical protein
MPRFGAVVVRLQLVSPLSAMAGVFVSCVVPCACALCVYPLDHASNTKIRQAWIFVILMDRRTARVLVAQQPYSLPEGSAFTDGIVTPVLRSLRAF